MKYKIGQIVRFDEEYEFVIPHNYEFVDGDGEFPNIIHGRENFDTEYYERNFLQIVDIHKRFYIVRYKDGTGKFVQLGFPETQLHPVDVDWKTRYKK